MMNYIWIAIIFFSVITAVFNGTANELSNGIITSGNTAVDLCFSLLGTFCLWNGLMNIAEKSGLSQTFAKITAPILCKIFKGLNKNSDAILPISLNITSNLLGLSNAATPIGIEAMKKLAKENSGKSTPSNNMVLFVVMNSAALRLIPSTVAGIRANHGSENPLEIIAPSILTSICALTVGISMTKILERFFKYE